MEGVGEEVVAARRKTLGQFLEQETFGDAQTSPELRALLLDLAAACKTIAHRLADAPLRTGGSPAISGGELWEAAVRGGRRAGDDGRRAWIARLRSGGGDGYRPSACHLYRGSHLAVLLPVDSPASVEVGATGGTIFSVLRIEAHGQTLTDNGFRQAGRAQLCSGYAIHGPSLVLVLAFGGRVQAFALDRQKDEFVLTHTDMRIPAATDRIAIDASRMRFWTPPIRRYVDECLAGEAGPRGKDFRLRWLGSMVAEAHCILMRGGVFVSPGRGWQADRPCQPWLLQEANPVSLVIEQAGGRASTGTTRILDLHVERGEPPSQPPLIFGSAEEVARLEAYHGGHDAGFYKAPLFAERGLFRPPV